MAELDYVTVARAGAIPPGGAELVEVQGRRVLLANVEGELYAIPAGCPHRRWLLMPSGFCEGRITCQRHGWQFDVASGKGVWPPFGYRLRHLPLRLQGDAVQVAWVEPEVELAH